MVRNWLLASVLALAVVRLAWPANNRYPLFKTTAILQMLDTIQADIKNYYYDPSIHGFDLDARFDQARKEIIAAKSVDEALLDIADAVAALNDSHTHFSPPIRAYAVDYGWRMAAIGESDCFVTAVRPTGDALENALHPGDRILSINDVPMTRQTIGFIEYAYSVIPQKVLRLSVRAPDGTERNLAVTPALMRRAMVRPSAGMTWLPDHREPGSRSRYFQSNGVLFWRLPDFTLQPGLVDALLDRTLSYKTVVLDLRGNLGGFSETLERFVGGFFDHDVKVGEFKGRQQSVSEMAASRKDRSFRGKLIVLVDSKTSSAAEIFARLVQLEKRGTVLGDRSSGAVMRGQMFTHSVQLDASSLARYGVEVSTAAMIMSDGKSLENVGVVPDEKILPTSADIAEGKDPVLARAAELAGLKPTAKEPGNLLALHWPSDEF